MDEKGTRRGRDPGARPQEPEHPDDFVAGRFRAMFGRRLRALRLQRHWTQARLAEESWLERADIAGIERGRQDVTLLTIMRLANALEVFPGELFKFSLDEANTEELTDR